MLTNHQFDRMRRLALSLAGLELVERHCEPLHRLQVPGNIAMQVAGSSKRNSVANRRMEFLRVGEHPAPADS